MKINIKIHSILYLAASLLCVVFYMAYANQKTETRAARFNAGVLAQRVGIVKAHLNFEKENYVYYISGAEPTPDDMKVRNFQYAKDMGFRVEPLTFDTETYPLFLSQGHIEEYKILEKNICRYHNQELLELVRGLTEEQKP